MTDKEMMAQRLREARVAKGYPSASAASSAFGWKIPTYTSHENGYRAFGVDEARRYGRAFRVNPGWLLAIDKIQAPEISPTSMDSPSTELLDVKGSVVAGLWREQVEWPADEWYQIEVGPPPYPGAERFALRMEGFSMDKTIPPGSDLECLRVAFGRVEPQIGDLVIAERTRHDLTELTCKRLDREGDNWLLRCESTKAEFQTAMPIGRPDENTTSQDDETRIIGIVVNAQQRHFRKRQF